VQLRAVSSKKRTPLVYDRFTSGSLLNDSNSAVTDSAIPEPSSKKRRRQAAAAESEVEQTQKRKEKKKARETDDSPAIEPVASDNDSAASTAGPAKKKRRQRTAETSSAEQSAAASASVAESDEESTSDDSDISRFMYWKRCSGKLARLQQHDASLPQSSRSSLAADDAADLESMKPKKHKVRARVDRS